MVEIIDLEGRLRERSDTVICSAPWEFRRAHWQTRDFVQMLKSESVKMECRRNEMRNKDGSIPSLLPVHFILKGSMSSTIRAMYVYRRDETRMRQTFYLTGLMDCMINQVCPVLRTDLLRAMYKEVRFLKDKLNVHWYGPLDQVLLPVHPQFYDERKYRSTLNVAGTMKELLEAIRKGTTEMFDILARKYVFYCPNAGG